MRVLFDLHTHTKFSDGKSSIQENIARAEEVDILLGASDHGRGQIFFGIADKNYAKIKNFIKSHNKTAKGAVLVGIEGNLLSNNGKTDLGYYKSLDYYILGFHRGIFPFSSVSLPLWIKNFFNKDSATNTLTSAIISAIKNDLRIQIISHPGLYLPIDMHRLSKVAAELGVLLEINEKHPTTPEQLAIAKSNGAKFIISSDAHLSTRIGKYDKSIETANRAGLDCSDIVNIEGYEWEDNIRLAKIKNLLI